MKEFFKEIDGYPNYEISNLGRVRNIKVGRVLRQFETKYGYVQVSLCKDRKQKSFLVHRLVATAFIPNFENKREINHIDGDKTNNCVSNLEWSTRSENVKHAWGLGLKFYTHTDNMYPSKQKVRCIETQQEFDSQGSAGKYFGVSQGSIHCSIHKGCRCKGYHFELV